MQNDLGKIHIYTGDGKGKTTAALGLALRAAGAGCKVQIVQFLKNQETSEWRSLKSLKNIAIKKFGRKNFIFKKSQALDRQEAAKALAWAQKVIKAKKFNLVILDEIFLALFFKLIPTAAIVKLIKSKPKDLELILTGRKAPAQIIKLADYVTEMKAIRHPYQKGLLARKGIEY